MCSEIWLKNLWSMGKAYKAAVSPKNTTRRATKRTGMFLYYSKGRRLRIEYIKELNKFYKPKTK